MKNKIKKWYDQELRDIEKVKNAVKKGVITEEDYKEITGETYN